MKAKTKYLDVKKHDRLQIKRNGSIDSVVDVLEVTPISVSIRYQTKDGAGIYTLKRGEYLKFREVGMYNYGSRNKGIRAHVKLDLCFDREFVRV